VELVFIRHGQPEWDRDGRTVVDPCLTEVGLEQAQLLGEAFTDRRVDRLLVSPLVRAQQTSAPVAEAVGLEPETLPWLAEIASPAWDGTPSETVEAVFAEARAKPLDEQWDGLPGGESFRDFHRRVTTGLDGLLDELGCERLSAFPPLWRLDDPGPTVVVVAHAGTDAVCLGRLLGIDPVPWEWERFVSFHASVSVVRPMPIASAHSFSLFRFSDTAHLPDHLRTR
jgi:2,3-bisphosphoglycerate-dependent phosphoglycerate mutase